MFDPREISALVLALLYDFNKEDKGTESMYINLKTNAKYYT